MKLSFLSIGLLALLSPLTEAWSKEDREIFRIRDEISAHEPNPAATFYDILGISPSASQDDITKAYRMRTRSLHPDKVKQQIRAAHSKEVKDKKNAGANVKAPTQSEINAAVKKAGDAQARLSLIANILRGPGRDRYDHYLSNGFPLWKGTDYYYNRYRPGLGTAIMGVFLVGGGAIHYLILFMSWKRQKEFVERYIKFARDTAWGSGLDIPGVDVTPAAASGPSGDDEDAPPQPSNRRERRMMEKQTKREDGRGSVKKTRKAQTVSRDASAGDGPTGARKRVVAENGKILVVDSLGHVYLEGQDEDGDMHEFLLDLDELHQPTFKDTAVIRVPMWFFNKTIGRAFPQKDAEANGQFAEEDEDSDAPQRTPSTDSAGEEYDLLDKSTDALGKARASGARKTAKVTKRKTVKK